MAEKNLTVRILQKRDTAQNWTTQNPVLLNGELAIVDTQAGEVRLKIGNGSSKFTELPYLDEPIRKSLQEVTQSAQNSPMVITQSGELISENSYTNSFIQTATNAPPKSPSAIKQGDILLLTVTKAATFESNKLHNLRVSWGSSQTQNQYIRVQGKADFLKDGDSQGSTYTVGANSTLCFMYTGNSWEWLNFDSTLQYTVTETITETDSDLSKIPSVDAVKAYVDAKIASIPAPTDVDNRGYPLS